MRFTGLTFFTKNDYGIQVVFYFLYINMIISLAFLASNIFRDVKTATGLLVNHFTSILIEKTGLLECLNVVFKQVFRFLFRNSAHSVWLIEHQLLCLLVEMCALILAVFGYIYVFGSGLLGGFFFDNFVSDQNTSSKLTAL